MLPAVKALMRNRPSWNIGSAALRSIMTKATSSKTPAASNPATSGFVHPMV